MGHKAKMLGVVRSSTGFFGFGIATTSALPQILGNLNRCNQEERKSHNQDFRAAPAWGISSGKIQSAPGALPCYNYRRATVNSPYVKFSEIFTGLDVVALQKSDSS